MIKCNWCGQFISYKDKDAMIYTTYGSYCDDDPPESTYICGKCWRNLSDEARARYKDKNYHWRPATKLVRQEVNNAR